MGILTWFSSGRKVRDLTNKNSLGLVVARFIQLRIESGRKTQLAIETTCCRDVKDLGLSQNQAYPLVN